ncbi:MazG-like family protein [Alkaliphilus peptidifermentans]|uniref:MazG-like family protein n=1 Tax=Alkaliphilus peptidifermentans DSM 18978 TaxID=1120976 RepID=A0A1G5HEJ0_9FIRM|nr:MazG-like family protein [Alkaliphilus peptidifermentans]SCY62134.1 MazG-like family protein [Alkaliphilus peptidifermentans DSM 18978]
MDNKNHIDIGKNIKMIDFLKCELLNSIAMLFETMNKGVKSGQEELLEILANIILVAYSLGKRIGIDYSDIDKKVQEKAKLHMIEEHHLEKWYGELTSLNHYIKGHGK